MIIFGVSFLIYMLIYAMPGDYIDSILQNNPDITLARMTEMKTLYGLDKGLFEGYFKWFSNAIRGDFGNSFISGSSVVDDIMSKIWISFWLAFIAFVLQTVIAIYLGIVAANNQYSKKDYFITVISLLGISIPSFFFAVLLQKFFALQLKILPLQGMIDARNHQFMSSMEQFFDIAAHMVLPIIVLTIVGIGGLMRYTRTNMLEVLDADYIKTARAKGLSEKKVIYKHAFRNTLIPLVTILGGTLPRLFAGAMIIEYIFSIPGVGRAGFNAITQGDIPYIMAFNMFMAVLILLGTLLSDILYAFVDPRIKLY